MSAINKSVFLNLTLKAIRYKKKENKISTSHFRDKFSSFAFFFLLPEMRYRDELTIEIRQLMLKTILTTKLWQKLFLRKESNKTMFQL